MNKLFLTYGLLGTLCLWASLALHAQGEGWQVVEDLVVPGQKDSSCIDLSTFVGEVVLFENSCAGSAGPHVSFELDSANYCIRYTGLIPGGSGQACVISCDKFGNCDSTSLFVTCVLQPETDSSFLSLKYGQSVELCIDSSELYSAAASVSWESQSGSLVNSAGSWICRDYIHKPGFPFDIITVVICDSFEIYDTAFFFIEASPYQVELFRDTVVINFGGSVCLDTTELPLEATSATPVLLSSPGNAVDFSLIVSQFCIEYEGKAPGTDTLEVLIRDTEENTDTARLLVSCRLPRPSVITDTLFTDETGLYCLDRSELAASLSTYSNACAAGSTHAEYRFDIQSSCVEVRAESPGQDSACFVLCDQFGVCDTFILKITILLDLEQFRIEAVDDEVETPEETLIQIEVLENDLIPGPIRDLYILDPAEGGAGPQYGLAVEGSPANRLAYIPEEDFCDGIDYFSYVVCNDYFCDTALVSIEVLCVDDPILVHNGFSPNGDGINDTFVIEGLSFFDFHHLSVYNRWGSLVYESQNYQNDWRGEWQGSPLPESAYFYRLEVEGGKVYSGYVEIRR